MPSPDSPAAPAVHDRFPIVRVSAKRARKRVIALYDDHLRLAKPSRRKPITPEMLEPEGEAELAKLKKSRSIEYASIKHIRVSVMGGNAAFKIRDVAGGKGSIALSLTQSPTVARILQARLPDRYLVYAPLWRISRLGAILLAVLGGYIAVPAGLLAIEAGLIAAIVALVGLCVLVFGVVLANHGSRWQLIKDGEPALPVKRKHGHAHHAARQPVRSRPLGILLRLSGVLYYIWITLQSDALLAAMGDVSYDTKVRALQLVAMPAPLLVFFGHRLAQRRYMPKKKQADQPPILFLRAFADDGKTTMQPGGWLASLAGIRDSYGGVSTSGRVTARDLMFSYNPITLLRRAFGYGSASAEETLARFFQKFGPVVAIGKPGERLATAGAARIYVDDERWQQTVTSEVQRAQFVVIQPGSSKGVAWELEQVRVLANPTHVLLSLASCWGDAETTDTLAPILDEAFGMKLPRFVAFELRPQVVHFDVNWRPEFVTVSYRNPLTWPLVPDATDLRLTLRPFLARARGEPSMDAPARWRPGARTTLAQWGSVVVGVLVWFGCDFGIQMTAANYANWRYEKDAASAVGSIGSTAASGTPITEPLADLATPVDSPAPGMARLRGKAVPYTIDVPEGWYALEPGEQLMEHHVASADRQCMLMIVASSANDNLTGFAEQRRDVHTAAGSTVVSQSSRALNHAGLEWAESVIAGRMKDGLSFREVVRAANISRPSPGVVMLVGQMTDAAAMTCRESYETAFASFRVTSGESPAPIR